MDEWVDEYSVDGSFMYVEGRAAADTANVGWVWLIYDS